MKSNSFFYFKNISDQNSLQELLNQILIELEKRYLFPKNFLKERYIPLDDKKFKYIKGFTLNNLSGYPFIVFAVCKPNEFNEAEKELRVKCHEFEFISSAVLSAGKPELVKILSKNFQKSEFGYVNDLDKYNPNKLLPKYGVDLENATQLTPLTANLESLFFDAHSIIRDIDGLHADAALDELCKYIYAKLFDEEQTLGQKYFKCQTSIYSTKAECATSFRILFKDACDYDLRVYGLRIPKYKKSRGVFDSSIKLSNAAIYKLIQLFESYSLSASDLDVKGRAFQKLYSPALRSGMGQYFTPSPIIQFMVKVIAPNINDLILDPFSGSGHFLTASLDYVVKKTTLKKQSKLDEFAFHKLHGIEKSERMVRISMTDMRLHGDGHSNIRCTDALIGFDNYEDLIENSFDIILSNPPFGSILTQESFSELGNFQLLKGRKTLSLEILGLERCIQFLRPKGKFAIVLPESIIVNKSNSFVRKWLLKSAELLGIIGLPLETFSPFGANIKTVILFGKKRDNNEKGAKEHEIFISEIESIGYDFKGNEKEFEDLSLVESEFIKFLKKHGYYEF